MKNPIVSLLFITLVYFIFFSCTKKNSTEPDKEYVTVLSPDGGENWLKGDTVEVSWDSNIDDDITIELYKDTVFVIDISTQTPNTGSYSWLIPQYIENRSDYRIKIKKKNDNGIFDFSNESLNIGNLILISPNGDEQYKPEDTVEIKWIYSDTLEAANIDICLYKNDDKLLTFEYSYPINNCTFTKKLPNYLETSTGYAIRINVSDNETVFDESNGYFNLINDYLITFGGAEDDCGNSVCETADGGFIITGYTRSFGAGDSDVWLIKTDSEKNHEWSKTFGGTGVDIAYSVIQTTDGSFIIAGYTESFGSGSKDGWLIKADSAGSELWNRTFGGTGTDIFTSVCQTEEGDYIIGGTTTSFGAGGSDGWLLKADENGNKIWDKYFGSSYNEGFRSVQLTSDSGFIMTGSTSNANDILLIKSDSDGNSVWEKTFDYSDGFGEYGCSVQQTTDSGYIIAGIVFTIAESVAGLWLIKTDNTGNKISDKILGLILWNSNACVQQTTDEGYIITSIDDYDNVLLLKTDSNGDIIWKKNFGGQYRERGNSVNQISGGYIIVGSTESMGAGMDDVLLIKTDIDGNLTVK